MAEIALPILGLGALYLMSNQDNEKPENYENMGASRKQDGPWGSGKHLPNTNLQNINYPMSQRSVQNTPIDKLSGNSVREYLNPNQTTDKFYNDKVYLQTANQKSNGGVGDGVVNGVNKNQVYSLTGEPIQQNNFKHNNMVPFFGGKIKGATTDSNINESILDNMQGAGSQWPSKVEQAPLFKPQENMQWSHGMPNESNFYQSRQNPSTKIANVLPWEQEKVAPGLGLGYTTEGQGGFNAGTLDRDKWLDRNVDQLRVVTNPKVTFGLEGHEGPAIAGGTTGKQREMGTIGTVEKNRPDTDYKVGAERWFTTTGASIAPTMAPKQILHDNNRPTTSEEYFGAGGHADASYLKGNYEPTIKQQLPSHDVKPASAMGQGNGFENNYGANGYKVNNNNRELNSSTNMSSHTGIVNGALKAMVAPIIDILRPSRKENFISNPNPNGNITSLVPNLPITNPNDKLKTTIKETTVGKIGLDHLNVSSIGVPDGGYLSTNTQVRSQQRNTTDCESFGNIGTVHGSEATSVAAYNNQRNNVNKTHESRPNPGGTSMFTSNHNIKIDKLDNDRDNKRQFSPELVIPVNQLSISGHIPSVENYGKINMPQYYESQNNRMAPDILTAFKNNPYAQSLSSVGPH